ncbi:MAG: PBSX family phage terminase large subunit [Oscillospiraceae bacterium]|nr:PBSX family phage terminase large subunit [Oscillospiraceae bacterium]
MTETDDVSRALTGWYLSLAARSNAAFLPLYFDTHRYLVLKGGGGSGKSVFAATKLLERCLAEPGHRFLVCRKVARTLKESCWRLFERMLSERGLRGAVKLSRSEPSMSFPNGSMLLFAGLDDVEKLKSIADLTGIWVEEASEITEDDFRQLDIRLRGETAWYKQIILSFNPVSANHWLKRRFFDEPDARARVHESCYLDNRFLDAEAVRTLEDFAKNGEDDYHYQVYCLGHWGVTGNTVFHAPSIQRQLDRRIEPARIGYFRYTDDGRALREAAWTDDPAGFISVYAPPEPGAPYVIGADTAGEGSDCFVAQVLDNRTGRQAAVLRRRTDEDLFARQLWCLGRWYNWALIGVETNFSTYPILELERLRYPRQYVRETVDDYTHAVRRSYGFRTDSRTRPVIIAGLVQVLRDDPEAVCDRTTLLELLSFVRTERWDRPEAAPGAHDDCVMALAIAHGIRGQQSYFTAPPAPPDRSEWTRDRWEDWERATPEEREEMMKRVNG